MPVQNAFKHIAARKHVIWGGMIILLFITMLSCVASFHIYRAGFLDMGYRAQNGLALAAVGVVEGAFVWLVYGFTRAFSSKAERGICLIGIIGLIGVMAINIITHFMNIKGLALNSFQVEWMNWGAVVVFIGVLVIVLLITLADPVIRLIRLELRYKGKQEETILAAKLDGLEGEAVQAAMADRAAYEAGLLAEQVRGAAYVGQGSPSAQQQQPQQQAQFYPSPVPTTGRLRHTMASNGQSHRP